MMTGRSHEVRVNRSRNKDKVFHKGYYATQLGQFCWATAAVQGTLPNKDGKIQIILGHNLWTNESGH